MDTENLKKHLQSKRFKKIIICVVIGVIALLIFEMGMQVGYLKASFSYKYGDSYYRSFGPENERNMGLPSAISDAHGVSGKIVSVSLPTMVVADQDNTEKVVLIDSDTVLRQERNTITSSDLATGQFVVVIGEPNDSEQIDAKIIRVLPPQPAAAAPATGSSTPTPAQ